MKKINILLVDDHKLIRDGIRHVLSFQEKFIPEFDEAENGNEAIQKAAVFDYDIIIMDIQMPEKDGIEATRAIVKKKKNAKILCLSMFDELHFIHSMIEAGASGYVLKTTGPEELSKAIITIIKGEKFYSNEAALKLMGSGVISKGKKNRQSKKLSVREIEIIKLIVGECTNDKIASKLYLSKRTIENHRFNLMKKLGVKSTAGIIKYAVMNKLV